MNTLLIPLDGSELAERALDPGLRLAARHGARVVAASIVSDLPPVPFATGEGETVARWFADEERRAESYLSQIRESAAETHPDVQVDPSVEVGPVARSLLRKADEESVDLIVLTTHGRGAWQRAWLGSVADALLRESHRPLLLLRQGSASQNLFANDDSPAHVLVPLDGSAAAEVILEPLSALLPPGGGRVTLKSVVRTPFPLATTYLPHALEEDTVAEEQRKRVRSHLLEVAEGWSPPEVEVEVDVGISDDVAGSVLAHAERSGVELLALGTRGRGGISRLLLGSVADKLIRGSDIPILATRRKAEDRGR